MRVLVVEDDMVSRRVLVKFLEPYGECDCAEDGYQALEHFQKALDAKDKYHLICLDIMMPGMDGHEVLKEIRRREAEKGIHGLDGAKVIMTTALSDRGNIMEAFRSQCEAYLFKPIDRQKLLDQVRSLGLMK